MATAKILVVSDTHFIKKGQSLPDKVTRCFGEVDHVIHAGDYTSKHLLLELKETGKFTGVHGNMDPVSIKKELPEIAELLVTAGDDEGPIKIGIVHGWGGPKGIVDRLQPLAEEKGFDVLIFGHTHQRHEERRGSVLYLNPGSPVDKVFAKENSFLLVTIDSKEHVETEFVLL